ncbi:MAG: sensor domain-containing diguanylate cyclase [Deltaproteobacteria bacterium]|nr:sensor domain-containing diguanylate cyclase [Deltaproteobacteria bacterium]
MSEIHPLIRRVDPTGLLDELCDAVYCVDRARRIIFWNQAAEALSGFAAGEVMGARCSDNALVHVDAQGKSLCQHGCPLQHTLGDGEKRQSELYLRHKSGHRVPVLVRVSPLRDLDGTVAGAIEVFSDNSTRHLLGERITTLERLAMLDQLTELPNRRYLEMSLALRHNEQQRYGWPYGVLLADIDHFKAINDRFGHEPGDRALRMVARTLQYGSRAFDMVGRWGGEEFLGIVSHVDSGQLSALAERLRALVQSARIVSAADSIQVTISIGAAMAEPGEEVDHLLRRVDARLYQAKANGRNQVVA